MKSLPEELAEEARQETVRIIKSTSTLKDNITKAERAALRTLKNNTDLTILPEDKGNATVILTLWTANRRSPPFLRLHHTEDWPGILLIRQKEKPHYCLKMPLSRKIYASNCSRPAPDTQGCMELRRYIKRGFLCDPLSGILALLPTNTPST